MLPVGHRVAGAIVTRFAVGVVPGHVVLVPRHEDAVLALASNGGNEVLEVRHGPLQPVLALILVSSLLVMLLGMADDRLDLHSRYRLILQFSVAMGLSLSGIRLHVFPIAAVDHLVSVLWIVGVINAMNCMDCADGAAGGTCLVVFATLAALAAANGQTAAYQASVAGAGAITGFLLYNVPPARVFLGDTGSTFLGLMAAVLAMLAGRPQTGYWHLPVAALALFVPVFDFVWVHHRRYRAGICSLRDLLASTGKDHLPHRLMGHGLSGRACMGVVLLLSMLAAAGVLGLAHQWWGVAGLAMIGLLAVLWGLDWNSQIVIRAEDHVALWHRRDGSEEGKERYRGRHWRPSRAGRLGLPASRRERAAAEDHTRG